MRALLLHYLTPSRDSLLFACKGLFAVALALAISMSLDLDKPFWAMVASMMLQARPEPGMVIEKALCLVAGSIGGALVAVFILDSVMPYPFLAMALLTACVAASSAVASTERHVNFIFGSALVAVTAILIVMFAMADASSTSSESIFLLVRARLTEVMVGAACATVASLLVFPLNVQALLQRHTHGMLSLTFQHVRDLFDGNAESTALHRQRLEIISLAMAITDDANAERFENSVYADAALGLAHGVLKIIAVGHAIEQAIEQLPREQRTHVYSRLASLKTAFAGFAVDSPATAVRTLTDILLEWSCLSGSGAQAIDHRLDSLTRLLFNELLTLTQMHQNVQEGRPSPRRPLSFTRYRDWVIGLRSAVRSAAVFVAALTIWIASDGAPALIMMMVLPVLFSIMFAGAPNPPLVVRKLGIGAALAIPVAIFYCLPLLGEAPVSFAALIAVLAAPLFIGLMSMTSPPLTPYGLGFCLSLAVQIQPSNYMTFTVDTSITTGLGIAAGLGALFVGYLLIGPAKGAWLQHRVLDTIGRDLQSSLNHRRPIEWFNRRIVGKLLALNAYAPATEQGQALVKRGLCLMVDAYRLSYPLPFHIAHDASIGETDVKEGGYSRSLPR